MSVSPSIRQGSPKSQWVAKYRCHFSIFWPMIGQQLGSNRKTHHVSLHLAPNDPLFWQLWRQIDFEIFLVKKKKKKRWTATFSPFYTPVEDGTYYGITRGGRAGVRAGGRRPVLCPEHISKTTLARVMKFHGWIDLIRGSAVRRNHNSCSLNFWVIALCCFSYLNFVRSISPKLY